MLSARSGFTLIELLIVIGIIAILATVAVIVINPAELFARARDTERINEIQGINRGMQYVELYGLAQGSPQTVYVSLPDSSPTCASYILPALTSGWSYACAPSATYQKADGTGWIPVDFAQLETGSFSVLPIDPANTDTDGYYYTYTPGGSWVLTAGLESAQQLSAAAVTDDGSDERRFELGSDIALWSQSGGSDEGGGGSPPSAPTISDVSPTSGSRGATLTLTVSGANFTSDAAVTISGTRVTVNSTTYMNSGQVTASISIAGNAQKTDRDVIVTTPAGSATCSGCFTVTN
jgi:prepilin-type N-terminal cleavage/methylation domain-containing protein